MTAGTVARTPPYGIVERRESHSPSGGIAPRILTCFVLSASALGLLSVPINVYDDSLFLLGARLVASGKIPYVDFYSHYGPLGYTILAFLLRLAGDPALALRVGEILLLAGMSLLLHLLFRSLHSESPRREDPVPFLVLALSGLALYASFFGFVFAAASVVLFLLALSGRGRAAILLYAGAGVALAAGALIRPAFGAYCGCALVLLETVGRRRSDARRPVAVFAVFLGTAALSALVLWFVLFPEVHASMAFDATVLAPARLVGGEGTRYLDPEFLVGAGTDRFGLARAIATGAALVALSMAWTIAVPGKATRSLAAVFVVAGGGLPLLPAVSGHPARDAGFVSLSLFALACAVTVSARSSLQESRLLRASATFGLVAAAFGHYFWVRADRQHLLPMLTLALTGAALLFERLRPAGRAALVALALLTWASAAPSLSFPSALLLNRGLAANLWPWRCTLVRADARMAVAYADGMAQPKSRFVAVGSNQALTSANPILLFLISSRLPYTKWFQYDPGVQTSPAVQREMERELEASGSRSAVVWRTERYLVDSVGPRPPSRSPFDEFFDRLYPNTAAKFGDYEVRLRAPAPPN